MLKYNKMIEIKNLLKLLIVILILFVSNIEVGYSQLKESENIESKIGIVSESCEGMDNHIQFIEGVYTTLRSPLDFIANSVRPMIGNEKETLPEIKNNLLKN